MQWKKNIQEEQIIQNTSLGLGCAFSCLRIEKLVGNDQ